MQSKEKRFTCPECAKAFTKASNLTQHLRIHTGEKPFTCEVCFRAFRQSGNLTKHLVSHENSHLRWNRTTDHKPFKCPYLNCGRSFTAKSSLFNHTRKHGSLDTLLWDVPNSAKPPPLPPLDLSILADAATLNECHEVFVCKHPGCPISCESKDELRDHFLSSNPALKAEFAFMQNKLKELISFSDKVALLRPDISDVICSELNIDEIRLFVDSVKSMRSEVQVSSANGSSSSSFASSAVEASRGLSYLPSDEDTELSESGEDSTMDGIDMRGAGRATGFSQRLMREIQIVDDAWRQQVALDVGPVSGRTVTDIKGEASMRDCLILDVRPQATLPLPLPQPQPLPAYSSVIPSSYTPQPAYSSSPSCTAPSMSLSADIIQDSHLGDIDVFSAIPLLSMKRAREDSAVVRELGGHFELPPLGNDLVFARLCRPALGEK